MRYVDAGYAAALGTLFVYAITLVLRRRRWARAFKVAQADQLVVEQPDADGTTTRVVPGVRP
jgi:hypothetical protein